MCARFACATSEVNISEMYRLGESERRGQAIIQCKEKAEKLWKDARKIDSIIGTSGWRQSMFPFRVGNARARLKRFYSVPISWTEISFNEFVIEILSEKQEEIKSARVEAWGNNHQSHEKCNFLPEKLNLKNKIQAQSTRTKTSPE